MRVVSYIDGEVMSSIEKVEVSECTSLLLLSVTVMVKVYCPGVV